MDILSNLVSGQGSELISNLVEKGFNHKQAKGFLPQATISIVSTMANLSHGDGADSILGKIDIVALAEQANLDTSLVSDGLQSIIPALWDKMKAENIGVDKHWC
ncbi:MAG: hypothetical protein GXP08_10765 [Gammaproteobacteria bacterium]|nr:hypothetical protein [Gammaproteobacteria bacterium]